MVTNRRMSFDDRRLRCQVAPCSEACGVVHRRVIQALERTVPRATRSHTVSISVSPSDKRRFERKFLSARPARRHRDRSRLRPISDFNKLRQGDTAMSRGRDHHLYYVLLLLPRVHRRQHCPCAQLSTLAHRPCLISCDWPAISHDVRASSNSQSYATAKLFR